MKGIILAGGSGSRLYPITLGTSKQLLNVYDKPLIYYPLSILMISGIREVLIISTPEYLNFYKNILGNGDEIGMKFEYLIQDKPEGIAQAFLIAEKFINGEEVCLILGDNIIYGNQLSVLLRNSVQESVAKNKAMIFGYYVDNPESFGIAEFDKGKVISIEEKPAKPKSNYAVIGLYFYPKNIVEVAKNIKPSKRGELEITSVNQYYLKEDLLSINLLTRGFNWMDCGTVDSLLDASNFVKSIQTSTGFKIGCIEEIAFELGYIDKKQFKNLIIKFKKNQYGKYLNKILNG